MENIKARFFEIYANLPPSIRDDVIIVIDEKTYSWNAVYTEVISDTELGAKMLQSLKDLGIVSDER